MKEGSAISNVQAIGQPATLAFLTSPSVRAQVSLSAACAAVREAVMASADGVIEQPLRLSLGDGRLLVMAARSSVDGHAIVKVLRISAHADTESARLPTVDGLILWLDGSGKAVWSADAAGLTLLRTAAMVSLATDVLAPPGATRLTILGAGHQAGEQLAAIRLVRPISEVRIWNRTIERAERMAADLSASTPGVTFEVIRDADEAVSTAQVVCCATASTRPLFDAASLASEVHVNAIGSYRADMAELPTDLLARATDIVVDDVRGCLAEAGEIIAAIRVGALRPDQLRSLAAALAQPQQRCGQTVFKSVGMAVSDLAVAQLLDPGLGDDR
ncbi:ornithine cyclodeaminase family protein [Dactylosporangium sp. CA-233914]|uniref:ornithine cyclodeaminase family protein n=1 Tax=Dactylosporangium sp. CA-233914 TaxID=3239934 RepID=UPI003D92BC5A